MKSKVKDKDKINKNKYDKLESIYTSLTQMFKSLPEKGDNCISFMKNCQKDHESQIEEITSELSKLEALSQRIEDYHQSLMKQIPEELKESSDVEDNEDEKEKIKEIQKYQEDELYANVDARETMKNDQKNIVIIKNLLQSAELKAEKDEEKRKLFKFQNQLDDLFKEIEIEEIRQGEQIDNIDKEVDDSLYRIEKANNQELEKAARIAINRRRLSYQIGLGATFGAIGSVVPGIGNAIGAALGALIGYGIYRVDKHRLNKATKNKEKLGNEVADSISKIIGKIGVNNPIGFINKLTSQTQDKDSFVSLKEFLNLIEKKNIKITDCNIDWLIEWLLNTPKIEEENINKLVGTCIGLIVKLDKSLLDKYISLLKENTGSIKTSLLNGAKEILKSKIDFTEQMMKPLYEQILEGIKSKERLIKEHSLQALSYIQYKDKKTLLGFYLDNENRKIIEESCKRDKAYVKVADFGNGNIIVEDGGKGIRQAALDIQTFMIENYPDKINYDEMIPLLIECLLETENYLQQIVYDDLIKLAKLKLTAFSFFGGQLIQILFPVFRALKIEESKRNFSINVKNLFEELKDVDSVTGHQRYNQVVDEINKH